MNTQEIIKIKGFLGKNNVSDAARVVPKRGLAYLTECINVDIDNDLMPHRSSGYETAVVSGTRIHSLWSNGSVCLFVHGNDLKIMDAAHSPSLLQASGGSGRMSYVDIPPKIFLTNESIIGYVQDLTFSAFTLPSEMTYKILMPAGHLIGWYNGRLLVARGNDIWYSDAMYPGIMDERRNFKSFPSRISMMGSVQNGLWVSDQQNVYFLSGADIKDSSLIKKSDKPAILGTSVTCDSQDVDGLDISGKVILWLSKNGVCLGGADGYFKELTKNTYNVSGKTEGYAILKKTGNATHFFSSVW